MSAPVEITTREQWVERLRLLIEREGYAAEMVACLVLTDPEATAALSRTEIGRAALVEFKAATAARKELLSAGAFP